MMGKVFTSGKLDFDRVSRQLVFFEHCGMLRQAIEKDNADGVYDLIATRKELTNIIFDAMFSTPLHLAVELNSVRVVEVLLANGAVPRPNFSGDFPWEHWGCPRWSAAARA